MISATLIEATDAGDVAVIMIGTILGLGQIVLWIAAAISIIRNDRFTRGGKLLWFAVIIGFPFLGCLGWFFFGRTAQIVKASPAPQSYSDDRQYQHR